MAAADGLLMQASFNRGSTPGALFGFAATSLPFQHFKQPCVQVAPTIIMHFINILVSASLALCASAAGNNATDIAASVQNRLARLEVGYLHTNLILDQVTAGSEGVKADDVVSTYLKAVAAEDQALDRPQPARPIPESTQLTLCQAFHSLTITGLNLDKALYNNVDLFNQTQRGQILDGINMVSNETSRFYDNVASKALTYCVKTVQTDNAALAQSFDMVHQAYAASN
ncbi:hypothetical protein BJY00DRAFT_310283 [Aspergillus carlsbadensis]|nr:hypothetical protein BJY00DRAFT_310283 [Aspergillus carlsbadensis]